MHIRIEFYSIQYETDINQQSNFKLFSQSITKKKLANTFINITNQKIDKLIVITTYFKNVY